MPFSRNLMRQCDRLTLKGGNTKLSTDLHREYCEPVGEVHLSRLESANAQVLIPIDASISPLLNLKLEFPERGKIV